jgi:hypothetical protein
MIKVHVDPGICGLHTDINVYSEDMQKATVEISSQCPSIQAMAPELTEIDPMQEAFAQVGETQVYEIAKKHCKHAACPVPSAIVKGIEAAAGLALPKNVHITIDKEE